MKAFGDDYIDTKTLESIRRGKFLINQNHAKLGCLLSTNQLSFNVYLLDPRLVRHSVLLVECFGDILPALVEISVQSSQEPFI